MIPVPDIGTWREMWADVPGWVGADGFHGLAHPDGRYLFLNGDTFHSGGIGTRGRWTTRQSTVVWDGTRLRVVRPLDSMIPETETGWDWGGPMVWDGPDIWCMSLRAEATTENAWGFRSLPRSLVQLSWPSWTGEPTYVGRWALPPGRVDWGASVARTTSWIYIFGVTKPPGGYGHHVHVARVRAGWLPDLDAWEYYARYNWSDDPDEAVPVLEDAGPAGTFSVQHHGGMFWMTSKADGDFGRFVSVWSSEKPYGPWRREDVAEQRWSVERMAYGATAHPDLRTPNGRYLVSIPHNKGGATLDEFYDTPEIYRPEWLSV